MVAIHVNVATATLFATLWTQIEEIQITASHRCGGKFKALGNATAHGSDVKTLTLTLTERGGMSSINQKSLTRSVETWIKVIGIEEFQIATVFDF